MVFKLFKNHSSLHIFWVLFLLAPTEIYSEMTARWEIIEVKGDSIHFIDRDSISMNENIGRIWQLQNFREVMRLPPQSISTQMDYHCGTSRARIFVQYHHTGVMSKGRLSVANIEGKDDWFEINKNSKEARIFRIICEKEPTFAVNNPDDKNNSGKKSDNSKVTEVNQTKTNPTSEEKILENKDSVENIKQNQNNTKKTDSI